MRAFVRVHGHTSAVASFASKSELAFKVEEVAKAMGITDYNAYVCGRPFESLDQVSNLATVNICPKIKGGAVRDITI